MAKFRESEILEFKKSTSELKEAIISIVSILNKHKSGTLYFGISNDGRIVGQQVSESTLREISQSIASSIEPKIYPRISIEHLDGKDCIKLLFEGHDQPYFAYGRSYMRVADEDRQMSAKELENLILKKNKDGMYWDKELCRRASIKDISSKKVAEYARIAGKKIDSLKNFLKKTDLFRDEYPTNASIVLFGKKPENFFDNNYLRCAVFATGDSSILVDRKEFYGDIFYLIDAAQSYILKNINIGMRLEGLRRVDVPEINPDAIREALLNAFGHRDYRLADSIDIALFRERIEIRSPGLLIDNLTIAQIKRKQVSARRNPLIAKIFKDEGLIESWGTGIKKMRKLEPKMKFEEIGKSFVVIFPRKVAEDKASVINAPVNAPVKLSGIQRDILAELTMRPSITFDELSILLKRDRTTIKRNIQRLKKYRIVRRIGPDKGGYWKIIKDRK